MIGMDVKARGWPRVRVSKFLDKDKKEITRTSSNQLVQYGTLELELLPGTVKFYQVIQMPNRRLGPVLERTQFETPETIRRTISIPNRMGGLDTKPETWVAPHNHGGLPGVGKSGRHVKGHWASATRNPKAKLTAMQRIRRKMLIK